MGRRVLSAERYSPSIYAYNKVLALREMYERGKSYILDTRKDKVKPRGIKRIFSNSSTLLMHYHHRVNFKKIHTSLNTGF